jgi:hypothetical protein
MEEVNCTEPSLQLVFPACVHVKESYDETYLIIFHFSPRPFKFFFIQKFQ